MKLIRKILSFDLKQKLMLAILIGCAIPFIFGAVYLNTFVEQWFTAYYESNVKQLLVELDDYITLALDEQMTHLVEEISSDERVRAASDLRNYLNYKENEMASSSDEELMISRYFENIKSSHPDVLFVFLGLEDGSYMEYPEFKPSSEYDPRVRPWYINSLLNEEVLETDPYLSKVTFERVVSFTKQISLDNGQKGVVGIAVSIESISDKIEQIQIDNEGYIIVLNKTGHVITSPMNEEWILKSMDDINVPDINRAIESTSMVYGEIEGTSKYLFSYRSQFGTYTSIAVLEPQVFQERIRGISMILIGIFVLTFVLLIYISNYVINRFTEPIMVMSESLRQIRHDVNAFESVEDFDEYRHRTDEIGIIAAAIHALIVNTKESFDLLIKKNEEIGISNELLAASEEELKCQVEEIEENKEYIEFLAMHDSLTEIPNRRYFYDALAKSIIKHEYGAIILMDIDNFKRINDTLGHKVGDDILVTVAKRLSSVLDDQCILCRFGGDEFFIIRRYETRNQIDIFLEYIKNIFYEPIVIDNLQIDIQFSIGASFYPEDSKDVNQLIMNADLAMYFVKNQNKNDFAFYSNELMEQAREKTETGLYIKNALIQNGFKMVYQPIINCKTGEVDSFEALLRFKDHAIAPNKFIAVAEEDGSIISVGRHVVNLVIEQLREWIDEGLTIKPVSINFSAKQLYDRDFLTFLKHKLEESNVDACYLKIEMTESVFFENSDETLKFINGLRKLGIKVLIDDFGSGYSSLAYLTTYPIDVVKLDKSINEKYLSKKSSEIIQSIINLVHSLNLEVVAEGIETRSHFILMQGHGCNYIQGFVFSRPLEASEVKNIINHIYF